jgi:hypothetical protein
MAQAIKVLWTADEPEFHGEFSTSPTTCSSPNRCGRRTQHVIELIAELDRARGDLDYWAATEVMPIFRPSVV